MSFFRSVMRRYPPSSSPTSPVCSQPSWIAAAVVARPVPIAVHHQVATHHDLTIRGDAQIDPKERCADGIDADRIGRIGADHRPGLGLAVALHDRQAERQEECSNVGIQPRAT